MPFRYLVDADGVYVGCYSDSVAVPPGLTEVTNAPKSILQRWDGQQWTGSSATIEERYGTFRMSIFASAAWARLRDYLDLRLFTELVGSVAYFNENQGLVKHLWNTSVSFLSGALTTEEINELKSIVILAEIGRGWLSEDKAFDFNDDGTMY